MHIYSAPTDFEDLLIVSCFQVTLEIISYLSIYRSVKYICREPILTIMQFNL